MYRSKQIVDAVEANAGINDSTGTDAELRLPLAEAQRGVWLAQQVEASTGLYNIGEYLELRGALDVNLLRRAVNTVAAEAEVLRTAVRTDGDRFEQIVSVDAEPPLEEVDLAAATDPVAAAEEWMRNRLWVTGYQGQDSLIGFAVIHVGPNHALFFMHGSHVVIDGYGGVLIAHRISQIYAEISGGQPISARWFGQLADLVAGDAEYHASDDLELDAEFWRSRLADRPEAVTLSGQPSRLAPRTHMVRRELEKDDAVGIIDLSAQLGVSTSTVLLAHVALLLWKATGRYDVPIGLPVGARVAPEHKLTPGMMSNILPVRLSGRPDQDFASLTGEISANVRASMKHQRYRYERMIHDGRHLHGRQDPLFGVGVNIMNYNSDLRLGDVEAEFRMVSTGPVHDVTLNLRMDAEHRTITLEIEGDSDRHTVPGLEALADRLSTVLRQIRETGPTARIGDLSLLSDDEQRKVVVEFNDTQRKVPALTLPDLISAQTAKTPGAPAVVDEGHETTYAELDTATETLAGALRELGIGPEQFVALLLPRSLALVIAALAVSKAGGAYVPVDPEYPLERVRFMLDDTRPPVVLTTEELRPTVEASLGAGTRVMVLDKHGTLTSGAGSQTRSDARGTGSPATPGHPAYMIYTSGSTGRPKGVVVPHSALVNRLLWMQNEYALTKHDRVLQKTPPASTSRCGNSSGRCAPVRHWSLPSPEATATRPTSLRSSMDSGSPCCTSCRPCWRCSFARAWPDPAPVYAWCFAVVRS